MSDVTADKVLAEAAIPGLDIPDAMARMGNSPKLYLRIIHSFIINMPGNLADLATSTINQETLADYAIRIHGAKGSCYGIGANVLGDKAKELEMAAKAGELDACLQENDNFIKATEELLSQLEALEARIEGAENAAGGKAQADKPDAAKLKALLVATQAFDINEMNRLLEELTSIEYAQDNKIVVDIKTAIDAFDYQTVEETIAAYIM